MATLRHQVANLVSVPLTMVRLSVQKLFWPNNLFFSGIQRFSPDVVVDTDRKSKICLGKRISIHARGRVAATAGGQLTVGNRTSFNVGCIVTCRSRIRIGNHVTFGPNVMMFDHDHLMDPEIGVRGEGFRLGEIEIGDNTWIGAGSIILSGARIGKNCVIAAGSVVKGEVPDNTVLIQKRENFYKQIG